MEAGKSDDVMQQPEAKKPKLEDEVKPGGSGVNKTEAGKPVAKDDPATAAWRSAEKHIMQEMRRELLAKRSTFEQKFALLRDAEAEMRVGIDRCEVLKEFRELGAYHKFLLARNWARVGEQLEAQRKAAWMALKDKNYEKKTNIMQLVESLEEELDGVQGQVDYTRDYLAGNMQEWNEHVDRLHAISPTVAALLPELAGLSASIRELERRLALRMQHYRQLFPKQPLDAPAAGGQHETRIRSASC